MEIVNFKGPNMNPQVTLQHKKLLIIAIESSLHHKPIFILSIRNLKRQSRASNFN